MRRSRSSLILLASLAMVSRAWAAEVATGVPRFFASVAGQWEGEGSASEGEDEAPRHFHVSLSIRQVAPNRWVIEDSAELRAKRGLSFILDGNTLRVGDLSYPGYEQTVDVETVDSTQLVYSLGTQYRSKRWIKLGAQDWLESFSLVERVSDHKRIGKSAFRADRR